MKVLLAAICCLAAVATFASFTDAKIELTFLSDVDKARLRKVVQLQEPLSSNDLASIYYYVLVNTVLDRSTLPDGSKICAHIQAQPSDQSLDSIFFATATAKLLGNCQLDAAKYQTKLRSVVSQADVSVTDLHKSGISLANLGKTIDSAAYTKALLAALKRDETLLNTGLSFQLAALFTKAEDRNQFADKIGDIVVQADEVNERLLQFEGGLGVSAAIVNGIYQLATASNKPVGITNEQALKFVNYFLSRKYVLTPKGASEVIETLSLFTSNKYHIPLVVTKYGSSALSAESPILTLKVTNVLGLSVGPVTVTGVSLTRVGEKQAALQNIAFKPVTGDSTLFAYDFFEKPLSSGFYTLVVNANPTKADSRIFGNIGLEIKTSILTQIDITDAELTITDPEVGGKSIKINYPSSLNQKLEADYSQRITLKFQIKDRKNGNLVTVHQAFVRFYNEQTKQEIIFIAEQDSTNVYKMDLNLPVRGKDFNNLSGLYKVNLIIGDALVMNSINWSLTSINLHLANSLAPESPFSSGIKTEYLPKPDIRHIFREQEKRPHPVVSNFFTILVMVPLLILFALWYRIGVNLSGFRFSLSAILFHTSLALIFLLYGCFFVKLNMFQTVKYLTGFGLLAYLSGHSLLSSLIKKHLK